MSYCYLTNYIHIYTYKALLWEIRHLLFLHLRGKQIIHTYIHTIVRIYNKPIYLDRTHIFHCYRQWYWHDNLVGHVPYPNRNVSSELRFMLYIIHILRCDTAHTEVAQSSFMLSRILDNLIFGEAKHKNYSSNVESKVFAVISLYD